MTAKQNLREMLALAIQLRRPPDEIAALRAELVRFEPLTLETIRARQDSFLQAMVER